MIRNISPEHKGEEIAVSNINNAVNVSGVDAGGLFSAMHTLMLKEHNSGVRFT